MDVGIRPVGAPSQRVELAPLGVRDVAGRLVSHVFRLGARPVARAVADPPSGVLDQCAERGDRHVVSWSMEVGMTRALTPRQEIWRGLLYGQRSMLLRLATELKIEHGLPVTWYEALLALWEAPRYTLTATQLAQSLLYTSGSASHLIARLADAGLISRTAAPEDARVVRLSLTPEGRERIEAATRGAPGEPRPGVRAADPRRRGRGAAALRAQIRRSRGRLVCPGRCRADRCGVGRPGVTEAVSALPEGRRQRPSARCGGKPEGGTGALIGRQGLGAGEPLHLRGIQSRTTPSADARC